MRIAWLIAGWVSVGLGFIGAFLPLMPTVVFLLIAAYCFARSSPRLHRWLVEHPRYGAPILAWQERGAISKTGKVWATISMVGSVGIAVLLGLPPRIVAVQAAVLAAVLVFIWTRPD